MAFNLLYLSGQHIYRMLTNFGGWEMDITTQTMLLVARLSSLGFCYRDGALPEDKLLKE
jgi:lysophospholipid acyltransferase 1/2